MNNTLALIVGASVLLISGLFVTAVGVPSISDLGSTSDNVKQDFCDRQIDQVDSEEELCKKVSNQCKKNNMEVMYKCLGQKHEDDLTP